MKMPKKVRSIPVTRWANEAPGAGRDAELGDVFRVLASEEPLDAPALAAVGRRLAQQSGAVSRRPLRFLPLALAVLVVGSGVALAEWSGSGLRQLQTYVLRPKTAVRGTPPRALSPPVQAPRSADVLAAPSEPAEPELSAAPVATAPAAASNRSFRPAPSALSLETELLQKAFTKLRRARDARGALALLDDYQARFPNGLMSLEAAAARVDALLLLGRRSDALSLLSRLPLERLGRQTELTLVRAELQAERDCSQALGDFDAVLAAAASGGLSERALYGRAGCRLRLGQAAAGHADLQAYLARFPEGRFAERVRARLAQHD
jgi:hypothetical protein